MRCLMVLSKQLGEDFCDPSAIHLRADLRHRVLNMLGQLGKFDESVRVRVAVVERIDQRPSENSVALIAFERWLIRSGSCQHWTPCRFVQAANGGFGCRRISA